MWWGSVGGGGGVVAITTSPLTHARHKHAHTQVKRRPAHQRNKKPPQMFASGPILPSKLIFGAHFRGITFTP